MNSPNGPMDAVLELLEADLRRLIYGLPAKLQESLPEQLKLDPDTAPGEEHKRDTPNG
jgi:hypothetical protein